MKQIWQPSKSTFILCSSELVSNFVVCSSYVRPFGNFRCRGDHLICCNTVGCSGFPHLAGGLSFVNLNRAVVRYHLLLFYCDINFYFALSSSGAGGARAPLVVITLSSLLPFNRGVNIALFCAPRRQINWHMANFSTPACPPNPFSRLEPLLPETFVAPISFVLQQTTKVMKATPIHELL